MRILKTGDLCPFCGLPLRQTDPEALRLMAAIADISGLPEPGEGDERFGREVSCSGGGSEE